MFNDLELFSKKAYNKCIRMQRASLLFYQKLLLSNFGERLFRCDTNEITFPLLQGMITNVIFTDLSTCSWKFNLKLF